MLTPDQIENTDDLEIRKISVPEWGGHVFVRTMSAGERDRFVSSSIEQNTGRARTDVANITARLLARTVCDESGKLLFPDLTQGQNVFARKSARACDRIFDVAAELNALTAEEVKKIASDFRGTTSDDSPTASPSPSAAPSPNSAPA